MTILQHTKRIISPNQDNNALTWLIGFNIVAFVLILLTKAIYYLSGSSNEAFYNGIVQWIVLPANATQFITRPWTILTYMFVHTNIWQALSNMLWLWAFGYILQNFISSKKIVAVYLYGGFAAAVIHIIVFNTIPALRVVMDSSVLLSASAGVMAIAIAVTTLTPNYRIFPLIAGGIPLWVLTIVFAIINIPSIPKTNPAMYLVYISSGTMGFVFIWQLKKGNDWSKWMQQVYNWLNDLFNPEKKHKKDSPKLHYKNKVNPFLKKTNITQQKVDELLDKINQHGYHSLTENEKDLLRKASKYL